MKETSAGAVIFRKGKYLLLHYDAGHWDFAKGHIEEGENEEEAMKREVEEETGINDLRIVSGFRELISYFFKKDRKLIRKDVVFFLAETGQKEVKLSFEHKAYKWLGYEEALKQLTFKSAKQILEKAEKFLDKKNMRDFTA